MSQISVTLDAIDQLLKELSEQQRTTLLNLGRRIVPTLTGEDLLQPNDYLELEGHPEFRYEEGLLAGIESCRIALKSAVRQSHLSNRPGM